MTLAFKHKINLLDWSAITVLEHKTGKFVLEDRNAIFTHKYETQYVQKCDYVGAFLIPYWIMLFMVGIPSFYLELTLGQKMRRGPYQSWFKIFPPLAGIGIASVITVTYISLYYNVIISWVLFYFVNSFHDPLPWEKCCGYKVDHTNAVNVSYHLMMGGNCSDVPTTKAIEQCTQDFTKCVCLSVCLSVYLSVSLCV